MSLRYTADGKERRRIRAALHGARPLVEIGRAGLSPTVVQAIEEALSAREAIKISVGRGAEIELADLQLRLENELKAETVAKIGRVMLIYRPEEAASENGP